MTERCVLNFPAPRQCKRYTIAEKISVIEKCEAMGWDAARASSHFNIDRTTIRGWLKTRATLRARLSLLDETNPQMCRLPGGGRKLIAVENDLLKHIQEIGAVTTAQIIQVCRGPFLQAFSHKSDDTLRKWVTRFLSRHKLNETSDSENSVSELILHTQIFGNGEKHAEKNSRRSTDEDKSLLETLLEEEADDTDDTESCGADSSGIFAPSGSDDEDLFATIQAFIDVNEFAHGHNEDNTIRLVVGNVLRDLINDVERGTAKDTNSAVVHSGRGTSGDRPTKRTRPHMSFLTASNVIVNVEQSDINSLDGEGWVTGCLLSYFIDRFVPKSNLILSLDSQFFWDSPAVPEHAWRHLRRLSQVSSNIVLSILV